MMNVKSLLVFALAMPCMFGAPSASPAADAKAIDLGSAEGFKGKSFDVKEKGKTEVVLEFPAGKEATITVHGDKKTDVYLFVYDADGKEVGKDDSPGPDCEVKLTPKEAGKYRLEIRNQGPGATSAALKVDFGKAKE